MEIENTGIAVRLISNRLISNKLFHENYERKPTALAVGGIESFLLTPF